MMKPPIGSVWIYIWPSSAALVAFNHATCFFSLNFVFIYFKNIYLSINSAFCPWWWCPNRYVVEICTGLSFNSIAFGRRFYLLISSVPLIRSFRVFELEVSSRHALLDTLAPFSSVHCWYARTLNRPAVFWRLWHPILY